MPPSAWARRPSDRCCAPVKAPRSWPNNSESMRVAGIAPQSTMTKGLARRALSWCTVCASRSLPVPLSPVMRTVVSVAATRRARPSRSFIADDWKTNWLCCKADRRSWTSACSRRRSCSARTRFRSARCSRSRATASCAATPVSTGRSDLSRSRRLGRADQRQRAEHAPTGDERHGDGEQGAPWLGRPCRGSLAPAAPHRWPRPRPSTPARPRRRRRRPAAPAGRRCRAAGRRAAAGRRRR